MAPTINGKLIESKRGGKLLTAGGHIYTVNQKRPGAKVPVINWRCIKQAMCVGTAKTSYVDLNSTPINSTISVTTMKDHLHDADSAEVAVKETINEIRLRARQHPNDVPSRIIQGVTNPIENEEVLIRLPERQNVARIVNRAQNSTRPRNPITLDEFRIEPPYNLSILKATFKSVPR